MYAFSTCWNSHRHTDGRAMLREIRELGFEYAELSHGIRLSLVEGILQAVDAGEIRISSLHNFCPLPMGVTHAAPNLFQFSAQFARERDLAVKNTLKTFDFAVRVGAPLVVLHMGSVEMKDYTGRLKELLAAGQRQSPRYEACLAEAIERREARKEPFVEYAHDTLRRLIPEAERRGLRLGIENREALEEIPFETDLRFFFREFSSPTVAYWHDTGHAQIKEELGLIHHVLHLESFADRLAGFHIHDVKPPCRDHCAPGTGQVDFVALRPWVRPEHVKVFELSPSLSADEVREGVAYLRRVWGEG
ncbi:MAG: TIM barrel protein [Verrucomicrobiota bacterium]|nr:sugar phosphate isomerase/epimerase [Limisphaera sp.]MDW8382005.1 TIM barrel protein [Verrucomicrobiota bacterium]